MTPSSGPQKECTVSEVGLQATSKLNIALILTS